MLTRNSSQRNYPRTKTIVISALEIVREFGLVILTSGLWDLSCGTVVVLSVSRRVEDGGMEGWSGATSRARTQCQERERDVCVCVG